MSAREATRATWTILRLAGVRQLTARRRRTALTLAGIAIGVSLVIAITLVNAAVRGTVQDTATGLAGAASFEAHPVGARAFRPAAVERARAVPGVAAVVGMTQQVSRLRAGGHAERALVAGVPPAVTALFPSGFGAATSALTDPPPSGVVLSPQLAERLDAVAGDALTVTTPHGLERLHVTAVLARGPLSSVNGGSLALLGLADARRVFDRQDELDRLYVTTRAGVAASPALRHALRRALGLGARVGDPGAAAQPYVRTFDGIAATTQRIRAVALLVAVFLVFNAMAMSLAERRRELALIALAGASRGPLVAAFVVEAALLGLVGGAVGVGAGFVLAQGLVRKAEAVYQSVLPITASGSARLTAADLALGLLCGAAVAMAGAGLAARRIVRLAPIEALRPVGPYAPLGHAAAGGGRRRLAAGGVATLAGAVLLVAFAPIDTRPALLGLVLVAVLAGAVQLLPLLVGALAGASRRAWPRLFGLPGRLAGDGLLRAPGRTTVAAGALALTAALVVASATGLGSFEREVNRAATTWYTSPLYVRANGEGLLSADQPLPVALGRQLERIAGVRAAYPMRVVLLEQKGQQVGVLAWPIAEAARHGDEITGDVPIADRRLVAKLARGEIVVSRLTARRHDLVPGGIARFPAPDGERRFRVAGVFNDLASTDALYIEHAEYRRRSHDAKADRFALELDRGADARAVAGRVQRFLDARGLPGTVVTSREMEDYVLGVLRGVFSLAGGAQLAALLIAAMVVLSTMLTVTFERRRELGVQRMLGMTERQLSGAVVLEAVAMAAVGAAIAVLIGLALGFVMTVGIEQQLAWHVTFRPAPWATLAAALVTVAVGAAAACYPSWLTTRPPLVELLRTE